MDEVIDFVLHSGGIEYADQRMREIAAGSDSKVGLQTSFQSPMRVMPFKELVQLYDGSREIAIELSAESPRAGLSLGRI